MEAIREAVLRLLQHVVLAAAGITGELGADIARLGDVDLETILGDLADLVREAGRVHAEGPPLAGTPGPGPLRSGTTGRPARSRPGRPRGPPPPTPPRPP